MGETMKFADFVCFEATVLELKAGDRDAAIAELVTALDKAKCLPKNKAQEITSAVIKRENEASTGLGKGIAVPHVKHASIKRPVAAIGKSTLGIDFCSLDKQPVYSIVMLISPADNADIHLQTMESTFRHLQNEKFRRFLRQAQTPEQIKDLLLEADENPSL